MRQDLPDDGSLKQLSCRDPFIIKNKATSNVAANIERTRQATNALWENIPFICGFLINPNDHYVIYQQPYPKPCDAIKKYACAIINLFWGPSLNWIQQRFGRYVKGENHLPTCGFQTTVAAFVIRSVGDWRRHFHRRSLRTAQDHGDQNDISISYWRSKIGQGNFRKNPR